MNPELYEVVVRPTFRNWVGLVTAVLAPVINVLVVLSLLLLLVIGERAWFDWVIVGTVVPLMVWLTIRAVRRLARLVRVLVRHPRPVTLRLDRGGVHVTNGGVPHLWFTSLPWEEVVAVVCSPSRSMPGGAVASYLQFVARHESAIEGDQEAPSVRFKAALLGVSPAAASMTWLAPRTGRPSVHEALDAVRLIAPTHVRIVNSFAGLDPSDRSRPGA